VTQEPQRDPSPTRRCMLAGVGLAGLAGTLAACSSGGGSPSASGGSGAAASTGGAQSGGSGSGGSGSGGSVLAATSDIPVGEGKVFASQRVVVTQPTAGNFKGFSAVCTHMQCIVDQVSDGTIDCPCHGSQFSIKDGSVVSGPAPSPLPAQAIKVEGGKIALA
jgi:nitrite reductase/ring-hydroxylating ferredoxin subunit